MGECVNFAMLFAESCENAIFVGLEFLCMEHIDFGILFDLDGVLIDSERLYTEFWADVERDYPTGIPDYPLAIKGTTLSQIIAHYPEGEVRDAIVARIHKFEDVIRYNLCPGVAGFLDELKMADVPMAIVTSSDDVKMRSLFKQLPELRRYFKHVIDGTMVTKSKPDPEGYLLGASTLGLRPEQCYVFEDSLQGIQAGVASGATVIGVASTFPRVRLQGKAHGIIDGFESFTLEQLLTINKL